MQRMRQGLLPESYFSGSQDPAHGGISAQVSRLRAQFQPAQQPQDASSNTHGSQALRVYVVRQGISQELRPSETRTNARRRRRTT